MLGGRGAHTFICVVGPAARLAEAPGPTARTLTSACGSWWGRRLQCKAALAGATPIFLGWAVVEVPDPHDDDVLRRSTGLLIYAQVGRRRKAPRTLRRVYISTPGAVDDETDDDHLTDHSIVLYLAGPDGKFKRIFTTGDAGLRVAKIEATAPRQPDPS